ncbi:glycosyltransferase family 4 protein [Candidatus Uhrbacteria bacterium]|nr:glycosyltransferase family 4 protein [Candidatus Uhrbacteria bacterium]
MSNITLVTLDYPPDRGGVARFLGNLVGESDGAMKVLVPEGHATDGPGKISAVKMFRQAWPRWWPMVPEIHKLKREAAIVFVSQVFPVGTAAWISKLWGGPEYVVLFHGLDLKLANSAWKRWLLRRICGGAKALFTNSRATLDELKKSVQSAEAIVMTPGIEKLHVPTRGEARRNLGLDPEKEVVLSVTRLVPRKGIDVSLHAMARIQAKRDVEYVVIGNGPDKERLQKTAEESRTVVRWITDADDQEKWLWFAAADIFLLPVREEENDMEGFGIVYLEAALAGVPSIAGKSGGAGEAVKNDATGLLVKPNSIDEIEEAVLRLLDDKELAVKLGSQGRERALMDFKWEERWRLLSSRI